MEEYVGEKLRIYFKPELLNRIRSKNYELGRPTCAAPSGPEAMAFVLPNDNHCGREYGDYLTAIDDIGVAIGLEFPSALPVIVRDRMESQSAPNLW